MTPLSILDLGPRHGRNRRARRTRQKPRERASHHAEGWGYRRIWVAEHHNMAGIASAATSVVLAHIAAGTKTIRVGAGGILLPNHAPYIIAEQFGTLERLFPGRIDLGLGRAPGTDQLTLRALRRSPEAADNFPQDVLEVQASWPPPVQTSASRPCPRQARTCRCGFSGRAISARCSPPNWGLPYAFASHFAPDQLSRRWRSTAAGSSRPNSSTALRHGRRQRDRAESDDEARRLATTQQMSFTNMFRGARGLSQPPIDDIETYWSPSEKAQAMRMLARSIVGSPETVRAGIDALVKETGADELIVVSDVYDHPTRLRSFEMIANAAR